MITSLRGYARPLTPEDRAGARTVPDHPLNSLHSYGSVCVHVGARLIVRGVQNGSVSSRPTATGVVRGTVNGSVTVAEGGRVEVVGSINGSVHVEEGGLNHIAPSGKLAGSLHVNGVIENEGVRGGPVTGYGDVRDVGTGRVRQPVVENGVIAYRW